MPGQKKIYYTEGNPNSAIFYLCGAPHHMFQNMFKYTTDSVADPHNFDMDPEPTFHLDGDLDPASPLMRIRILIFTLIKIWNRIRIIASN